MDVVPAEPGQFEPRVDGDRLIGRGAYDMKAALAAMMLSLPTPDAVPEGLRVVLGIVSDEESEVDTNRGSDYLVDSGLSGDFAIIGEPTDLNIGVPQKACSLCGSALPAGRLTVRPPGSATTPS